MKSSLPIFSLITANLIPLSTAACANGYHIIVAHAAGELPGEGSTGELVGSIASNQGVKQLHSSISSYVREYPAAKIGLLGYDQSAYVVADVLGGAEVNATAPVEGKEAEAVKGIILSSGPSHVADQPYDAGRATTNGGSPGHPRLERATDAQTYPRSAEVATDFIVSLYK